jgi:hypothetical protein
MGGVWFGNNMTDQPTLHTFDYLATFAHKVCAGKITLSGKACRNGNVETDLCAMRQTIALLGPNHHDPHLQPNGKLEFALKY